MPVGFHWFEFVPLMLLWGIPLIINLRQKTPPFRCTVRAGDEWRT